MKTLTHILLFAHKSVLFQRERQRELQRESLRQNFRKIK